jgi:hypothetical protein
MLTLLQKEGILDMKMTKLKKYCCLANNLSDVAFSGSPVLARTITLLAAIASGVDTTMHWLTIQEFHRGMSRNKSHYADFKVEKDFIK